MTRMLRLSEASKQPVPLDEEIRVLALGTRQFIRRVDPGMQILGVVQRGLEIGALVCCADGRYLKVNGDVQQRLNSAQIELALQQAGIPVPDFAAIDMSVAGPKVIVKRRKVLA